MIRFSVTDHLLVTPAKAGVQRRATKRWPWIPACAGMTNGRSGST